MKNKIRILHVVSTRPIGGIGTFLIQISQLIDKEKFDFSFIFSSDSVKGDFDQHIEALGFEVFVLPSFKKGITKYVNSVYRFYKKNSRKFDIIHVHSPNTGVVDLFCSKLFNIKGRIVHSHSTKNSDSFIKSVRNALLHRLSVCLSTNFFACSKEAGQFLFKRRPFTIINNSIDISAFYYNPTIRLEYRNSLDVKKNEAVLVHIGYFEKVKNQEFLIYVLDYIVNTYKKKTYKLYLIGEGKLKENMKDLVFQRKLEDYIFFLGYRTDISQLLQASDVFLLPSLFEGFPLSIIEAQAAGLPCVVSDSITKDVCLSKNVHFLPIDSSCSISIWADKLISLDFESRKKAINSKLKEYDIRKQIKKIEKEYFIIKNK